MRTYAAFGLLPDLSSGFGIAGQTLQFIYAPATATTTQSLCNPSLSSSRS